MKFRFGLYTKNCGGLDDREFESRQGLGIFLFTIVSRPVLELTLPPTRGSFLGGKAAGSDADHSPPSSAEVKECMELYFYSPNTPSGCSPQLKHRDNFTHFTHTSK